MPRKGGVDRGIFESPKGSGKWYACWKGADGKLKRKLIGTKENARAYYIKAKARAMEDENFPERAQGRAKLTLADLVERYRPEWQVKATAHNDDKYAEWWVAELGNKQAAAITTADVAAARARRLATITKRKRKTTPATANRHVTFLKRLFNLAMRDWRVTHITTNPCAGKILPKLKEQSSIAYVEEDSFPLLLDACAKTRQKRLKRAIVVAAGTGMRAGEQFGMHRSQVNFSKGTIALTKTKTGKTRYLALSEPVADALREQMASHKSQWVWPGRNGGPCDSTALNRSLQRALDRAGLPIMSWHKLRHSFGTWAVGEGADIVSVQEAMGHDSLSTTQVYTKVNASRVRGVFDSVGIHLRGLSDRKTQANGSPVDAGHVHGPEG